MQLFTAVSVAFALLQVTRALESPVWGQCGGLLWFGPRTCASGSQCTELNPLYSQCIPGGHGGNGRCSTPATVSKYNNHKLPNPFLFDDGTPVKTKDDWDCRRAQILALVEGYEAGALPGKPSSIVTNYTKTDTKATLGITVHDGGKNITFTPSITYPSGNPPHGGWPLVIAYDGLSIPVPSGIAIMTYANSAMGVQNDATTSRGVGTFYNLYGKNATASAMTAWAWGVSRIIDALEKTPSAHINTEKIAVTGCSRNGKGALMAGALEPRVALTIPQESGSGGDACWRLSKYEQDEGAVVQTATEIVQENVWFSTNFANYVNDLDTLPYDHHLLAALIAPRPMISFENTDFVWLSPLSSYGCMSAAHTVWEAHGVADYHGFEQIGGHAHCAWPAALSPQLNAFFDRFLLDQKHVNTTAFATNGLFSNVTWNAADWINWKTPKLH